MDGANRGRGQQTVVDRSQVTQPASRRPLRSADDSQRGVMSTPDRRQPPTTPVAKLQASSKLQEWCQQQVCKGCPGLRADFARVRKHVAADMRAPSFEKYGAKNRYRDVVCIEKTRVALRGGRGGDSYIHANYVAGSKSGQQFICTQAPTKQTLTDFWKMVAQEQCKTIIMLCRCEEQGEAKCLQYWPETAARPVIAGDYTIRLTRRSKETHGIIKHQLNLTSAGKSQSVTQYQYIDWPDRGVPTDTKAVLSLVDTSRGTAPPVVVHCSAGVGRTGTLVVAERAMGVCAAGLAPDVAELLKDARSQRAHCIQSEPQYLFVHRLIIQNLLDNYAAFPSGDDLKRLLTDLEKAC